MLIHRSGEGLLLRPDGSLFLPERRRLLVADLHLGKAESFQRAGIPVPTSLLEEELSRLSGAVRESRCEGVTILGDLLHHSSGVTESLLSRVSRWRRELPVPIDLVPGNHDRDVGEVLHRWGISLTAKRTPLGPFLLTHDAREAAAGGRGGRVKEESLRIGGHLHPVVRLREGGDALRLRCFLEEEGSLTLPAFARFAGGAAVAPGPGTTLYVIAEDQILQIGPAPE
jgi:hypothetical protein